MLMRNRCIAVVLALFGLIGGASVASAQASRTWVSGVGDDVNPCSRTAPCKTFAGAISKTAAKGEINVLDSGGFGAVTITKSISIEADEGVMAGISAAGTNGIIINAGAADVVTIRGLSINGFGTGLNGIRVLNASVVHIENCDIQNFVNRGIDVENAANAVQLFVKDTAVTNNFLGGSGTPGISGGVLIKPVSPGSVTAFFDNVRMDQNQFGLRVENNVRANIVNSSANGNTLFGFIAVATGGAPSVINMDRGSASFNSTGVRTDGVGAIVRMAQMQVTGNAQGIQATNSGQIISHQNNAVRGNTLDGTPTSNIGQQ
jgi:hypothetical protein